MKQIHEVAVVKDGNKRVGWLVKTGLANTLSGLCYVTEESFKGMVKENVVQYFVMEGGNLTIKYTEEEIKNFKSLIPGSKLRIPIISEAIDNDVLEMEPFVEDYYPKEIEEILGI